MFHRLATDGTRSDAGLRDFFAGPFATPCWIIGGGPSLTADVAGVIRDSPAPKFAINLAGSGLLRPNFWTSYDPTARFHRSIYLDPSIIKFVHAARRRDLVPETTFKVCDCPGLVFFDRDRQRGFHDFPNAAATGITDWQDSLIQAIDIAYQLGFRELLLAGCDMWIAPSAEVVAAARDRGVDYSPRSLLKDFFRECRRAGVPTDSLDGGGTGRQYHFAETKPRQAAEQTDFHYFRVAQYLRLSRRAMSRAGLRLVSATPGSRLNDDFPFVPVEQAAAGVREAIGDPRQESTRGLYANTPDRRPAGLGPMRDFKPHFWEEPKPVGPPPTPGGPVHNAANTRRPAPEEVAVEIREEW